MSSGQRWIGLELLKEVMFLEANQNNKLSFIEIQYSGSESESRRHFQNLINTQFNANEISDAKQALLQLQNDIITVKSTLNELRTTMVEAHNVLPVLGPPISGQILNRFDETGLIFTLMEHFQQKILKLQELLEKLQTGTNDDEKLLLLQQLCPHAHRISLSQGQPILQNLLQQILPLDTTYNTTQNSQAVSSTGSTASNVKQPQQLIRQFNEIHTQLQQVNNNFMRASTSVQIVQLLEEEKKLQFQILNLVMRSLQDNLLSPEISCLKAFRKTYDKVEKTVIRYQQYFLPLCESGSDFGKGPLIRLAIRHQIDKTKVDPEILNALVQNIQHEQTIATTNRAAWLGFAAAMFSAVVATIAAVLSLIGVVLTLRKP